MDSLVENLLDINRLDAGKIKLNKTLNSVNDIIVDTVNLLNKAKGNRTFIFNFDEKNVNFMFDFGFIRQAIFNILQNSCIYTPDDSTIKICTGFYKDYCKIEIADNGGGVPEENLTKLFDKFYRVRGTRTGGTGLGLSIAKGFINAHQGTIIAKSNKPSGLIFVIELPL
jgi:two-component system sensor histidine kinase KdpD